MEPTGDKGMKKENSGRKKERKVDEMTIIQSGGARGMESLVG